MVELKVVEKVAIPKGEQTTASALMPRVLCCISGDKTSVYRNNERVRTFNKAENGVLKLKKLYDRERKRTLAMYVKLTKNGPILIKADEKLNITRSSADYSGFEIVL